MNGKIINRQKGEPLTRYCQKRGWRATMTVQCLTKHWFFNWTLVLKSPPSAIPKPLYGTWFAVLYCWFLIKLIGSFFVVLAYFGCGCSVCTFCGWQVCSRFHWLTPVPWFRYSRPDFNGSADRFCFICFLHLVLRLMAVMLPGFLSVGELLQCGC